MHQAQLRTAARAVTRVVSSITTPFAAMLTAAGIAVGILIAVGQGGRFVVTASLPRGVYRIVHAPPVRGSIVAACIPSRAAAYAVQRGYLWHGECPGGAVPLGKVVIGVPGDTVTLGALGLQVNNVWIPSSRPRERDTAGRPLSHYPYGTRVLEPGQFWLFSPFHPQSFDSRYFGPGRISDILYLLVPLWTTAGNLSRGCPPQSLTPSGGVGLCD